MRLNNLLKKSLAIILFISGIMPLAVAIQCMISVSNALNIFSIGKTSDTVTLAYLLGVGMVPVAAIQFLAGYQILKGNYNGVLLARFIAFILLLDGSLYYSTLKNLSMSLPDIIKGLVILIIAFSIKQKPPSLQSP